MPAPRAVPPNGSRFALRGRVVTMDDARTVLDDGAVFVEHGSITAVLPAAAPPPAACADLVPLNTGATLYPRTSQPRLRGRCTDRPGCLYRLQKAGNWTLQKTDPCGPARAEHGPVGDEQLDHGRTWRHPDTPGSRRL